jgi:hypothetical protein
VDNTATLRARVIEASRINVEKNVDPLFSCDQRQ